MKIFIPTLLLSILLIYSPIQALRIVGKVVGISDGDTIKILDSKKRQHKIRLYGIDCPEGGQAYGNSAKSATSKLVYGKVVEVNVLDIDRYGRAVGLVFFNNVNINAELIKQGYAWVYHKYCKISSCTSWELYEASARNQKRGLWADPHPIPPWDYRASKRSKTPNNFSPTTNQSQKTLPTSGGYHGNVKSKVFHAPGCQHYNCKNCTESFFSLGAAKSEGYRPHKQCVK
nr:hypothetical protein 19 [Desulfobulbaceae bacterium]